MLWEGIKDCREAFKKTSEIWLSWDILQCKESQRMEIIYGINRASIANRMVGWRREDGLDKWKDLSESEYVNKKEIRRCILQSTIFTCQCSLAIRTHWNKRKRENCLLWEGNRFIKSGRSSWQKLGSCS